MNINPDEILGLPPRREIGWVKPSDYNDKETFFLPWPVNFTNKAKTKDIVEVTRKTIPDMYRAFFPRVYHGVDQFRDYRAASVAGCLAMVCAQTYTEYVEKFQAGINFLRHNLLWAKCKAPMFFVKPDFLESIMQTDLPAHHDFSEFKLPFDALTFVLPHKHRLMYYGQHIDWLSIAHIKDDTRTKLGYVRSDGKVDKIVVSTSIGLKGFFSSGFSYAHLHEFAENDKTWFEQMSQERGRIDKEEIFFVYELFRTAIKLILAMEAIPELVDRPTKARGTVQRRGQRTELWSPNVIGARFRINHETTGEGSHASPRMHWRRGHFRQQRLGARITSCVTCNHPRTAHYNRETFCELQNCRCDFYVCGQLEQTLKTIWIQPVLVNATGDTKFLTA